MKFTFDRSNTLLALKVFLNIFGKKNSGSTRIHKGDRSYFDMTGIRFPQHPDRVQGCEIRSHSFGSPIVDNLLRTHLIQVNRMQSPKNNEDVTYINFSALNEQPMMVETQKVEIVPKSQVENQGLEGVITIKKEKELERHPDEKSTSAHVVDELRRVLESRKKVSEAGTSRDEEDEMEVASSFSEQVGQSDKVQKKNHSFSLTMQVIFL